MWNGRGGVGKIDLAYESKGGTICLQDPLEERMLIGTGFWLLTLTDKFESPLERLGDVSGMTVNVQR